MRAKAQEKMGIWIVNHYAIPPQLAGGTRHYEFAADLARKGHLVTLWMSSFYHTGKTYLSRELRAQARQSAPPNLLLRWVWSSAYQANNIWRIVNMLTFAFLFFCQGFFCRKPHLILASTPHLFTALAGWGLSFLKRTAFILEVRDLWPEALVELNGLKNPLSLALLTVLEEFLYRRAAKIIVVTEGIGARLKERGIPPAKIVFIPNGVYLKSFVVKTARDQKRAELGFGDKFVVMYAGAHGIINSLKTLVRGAALLADQPHYFFALVGDGTEKKNLQQLAKDLGLTNLRFYDPVAKEDIPDTLNAADLVVAATPNTRVFQGARLNKLFDYMAAGKPILCAIDGESRRLVEETGTGIFVEPENPEALARGVEFMYRQRDNFPLYGARGKEYISKYCDREKLVEDLEEVLATVVRDQQKIPANKEGNHGPG